MAQLKDKSSHVAFEVSSIAPSPDGPPNAYRLRVRKDEALVLDRTFTTYPNSPDGHWYVWRLFRACQLAGYIADIKTPLNITGSDDRRYAEPSTISVSTGWLNMVLCSDCFTGLRSKANPQRRSRVDLYIQNGSQFSEDPLPDYSYLSLICRPADVVQFGRELEIECRDALRARRALNIMAPADDYIDS